MSLAFLLGAPLQSFAMENLSSPNYIVISEKLESQSLPADYLGEKLSNYYGHEIATIPGEPISNSLWIGYLDEVPKGFLDPDLDIDKEGFIIKPVQIGEGTTTLIVTSPSKNGLFYASAEMVKCLKVDEIPWYTVDLKTEPAFEHRNIWSWTNVALTGRQHLSMEHMLEPHKHQKYRDLIDLLINCKINAFTLWTRVGEGDDVVDDFINQSLNNFAGFLQD